MSPKHCQDESAHSSRRDQRHHLPLPLLLPRSIILLPPSRKLYCGEKQDIVALGWWGGGDTVTFSYLDPDIQADHHHK